MSNLDLEEQEKLAELKAWWEGHGNSIVLVISAAAIAVAGWQGWRWVQRSEALQASAIYETLTKGMQSGDAKAVRDAGGELVEKHSRTLYASMGALASARHYFERGDTKSARVQLQWVVEKSASDEFRDIARLRLAGLLLDEKAYDEALRLLEAKHADAFAAQYAALKGDILVAKNQAAEAKAAYKLALEKAAKGNDAFRDSVQMRLDALGG